MAKTKSKKNAAPKGAFPIWSAAKMFKLAGGGPGLTKLLKEHGLRTPAQGTLRVWLNRGFIPGSWTPTVCLALAKGGLLDNPLKVIEHANKAPVSLPDIFR